METYTCGMNIQCSSAVIIKRATYVIFATFQESQKTEKSLLAVVALKGEANGDQGNIF
jgi:hypothetical protein